MILYLLDLVGCAVFAISGALAAGRAGLDFFGVMVIATITAIGGGTLRDVLMNRHPVFWMRDPRYLYLTCITGLLTVLWVQYLPIPAQSLLIADALGLALFAMCGAQLAEEAGYKRIIVVLMGVLTGTAGGVIRDVLSTHVPLLLRKDIYASAAVAGICAYLLLKALRVPQAWAFAVGIAVIAAMRLLAVVYSWQLPVFHLA
jgi:uncharacterized membrane protein YeiH